MISAASVPAVVAGIGPELHHAERGLCGRVGVAVTTGANERIDIRDVRGQTLRNGAHNRKEKTQEIGQAHGFNL